ncbi:MAG: T9SS type A sorting domain-containing protein [Bacteroidota bacterium]|nr:T9SS type A sorting domain-containing protein [Bacteroidota bacterium]
MNYSPESRLGLRKLCPSGPLMLSLIFIANIFINHLHAQCALACRGKVNLSIGDSCQSIITPDLLLTDGLNCPNARYRVDVFDYQMVKIPGSPRVTIDHLGKTLIAMIYDSTSRNSCWGKIFVEDKFGPRIFCKSDTIFCNDTTFKNPPIFYDNCDPFPTIRKVDEFITPYDCHPIFIKRFIRCWQAYDKYGGVSPICKDTIYLRRIPIDSVIFPKDFTVFNNCYLSCNGLYPLDANGHPHPDTTGVPTVDGFPLWPDYNLFCNLGTSYEDAVLVDNGCKKKILRLWRVVEWWCGTAVIRTHPQIIEIVDHEPPILHCPYDLTVTTNGYSECQATFNLPPADVSDNCQDSVRVDVSFGGGILIHSNGGTIVLPVGIHYVTYRAYDKCYNVDSCQVKITVEDKTPPVPICQQHTVVSMSRDDEVHVYADAFDDGSHDECHLDSFLVRRMDLGEPCGFKDSTFRHFVTFCCADVGKTIMVIFRATDKHGNFNDCMVEVEVQDKSAPVIRCPHDYTISCNKHIDTVDLTHFGGPYYSDNCIVEMDTFTIKNLDQCGLGSLDRYFVIKDNMDRYDTCIQHIFVYDLDPFDGETDIIWPLDTAINSCGGDLDPKNLPLGYGYPIFGEHDCSLIGTSYEDHVFHIIQDSLACFKVLRKWKVIDWCQRYYDKGGNLIVPHWDYQQVLKIFNTSPPKPLDTYDTIRVCLTGQNCIKERVRITHSAIDDCTPADDLISGFKIDLYNNGLFDSIYSINGNTVTFDGELPIGEHRFLWIFEDRCGNQLVKQQIIRVINCKPPTSYCLTGVAINLMGVDENGDGILEGMITIWANDLDRGSYQICGNPVVLSFSRDSNDRFRIFNCDSIGMRAVSIYVTDRFTGLQDFCRTTVVIQDNNNICKRGTLVGNIAGIIQTPDQKDIQEVEIQVFDDNGLVKRGEFSGKFSFSNLFIGKNYTIIPSKIKNYLEGVTTLDIVKIQKHILGVESLTSVWNIIAGDVNGDHIITTTDVVALRKLILGIDQKLKNVPSWSFVEANYQFPDPLNPWYESLPDQYRILGLPGDMNFIDFKGIKLGDVSETLWGNAQEVKVRDRKDFGMYISNNFQDEHLIPIMVDENIFSPGMQFTLHFDPAVINVLDIKPGTIPIIGANISWSWVDKGVILVSWSSEKDIQILKDEPVFYLEVERLISNGAKTGIAINSSVLHAEIYNEHEQVLNIIWKSEEETNYNFIQFGALIPNPFVHESSVSFKLKNPMNLSYSIYNLEGKLIFTSQEYFSAGQNEIKIKRSQLESAGMYTLRIDAGTQQMSYKLAVLDQ